MDTWLGVEVRHLTALAAVAEEQSFRGAADRLGYVQSAVSQRISQLEMAVSMRLVERSRGHRHVELTEAGTALLRHAEQIQAQLNAARADLRALSGDVDRTQLRLGASGGLATRLVPAALARMAEQSPTLTVEIQETQSDRDLFASVESGRLDAAFAELPLEAGPFEWRELLVDPLMLLVPADSPLAASGKPPELTQIAAQPLIANRTWRMFGLVQRQLAAAGLSIDVRYSATSSAAVHGLVGAGLGCAVLPRLAVDLADPATTAIELDGVLPPRILVCYWPRERRREPALDQFLAAMDHACAALLKRIGAAPCETGVKLAA